MAVLTLTKKHFVFCDVTMMLLRNQAYYLA